MRRITLPGVLKPPADARLLATVMRDRGLARGARVLEPFTGSGAIAVAAALAGARTVTVTDIGHRAVLNARLNARLNGVPIRALRGDLFAPVAGERFDLVLANPPYVPSATDVLPRRGPERAWDAGRDGRALLDRFCAAVPEVLAPGGTVLVVHSSLSGEEGTLAGLRAAGLAVGVAARERVPLGPLAAARVELLEERGLLAAGEREEELLVVAATAPVEATDEPIPAPVGGSEAG